MGCNHMQCFQCNSHFCYLCGAWLDRQNPYQHFNKPGTECYQRLWELEEGDEGQGPEDGRGFAGMRRWEQQAIEVARQADEQEAEEARVRGGPAEGENADRVAPGGPAIPDELDVPDAPIEILPGLEAGLADLRLQDQAAPPQQQQQPPARQRRQRNLFAQAGPPPAGERGQAVRNYERNHGPPVRGGIRGVNIRGINNVYRRQRQGQEWGDELEELDRYRDEGDGEDAQG